MYAATMNKSNYCRRAAVKKSKKNKVLSILLVLSIVTIVVFSFVKTAQAKESVSLHKYYKTIVVQPDDTLWDLAEEYKAGNDDSVYSIVNEIKSTNHLYSNTIHAGMNLIIPYYAE